MPKNKTTCSAYNMTFSFNIYSTPLLFGFTQGILYAVLFWVRGWRQGRLSDGLFGGLLLAFSFEIWEYMLGFAGVEVLWNELDFFPRNFGFLLPPLAYFYLKSQFNTDFQFTKKDLRHAVPFFIYVTYHVGIYAAGPQFVGYWKEAIHFRYGIEYVETVAQFISQMLYFYWAWQLYREYQQWAPSQFSDTEAVSFRWFRNFLLAFFISSMVGWVMTLVDLLLNLDFWHDWWDELFNAALIYYLALAGMGQVQPRKVHFEPSESMPKTPEKAEKISDPELESWRKKVERLMVDEKMYLQPELTLSDLAQRLNSNVSVLSAVINNAFGKNFNDYINEYRVAEVTRLLNDPSVSHLSLLGIGLECGFNSKSTFNRAFKKATGMAPGELKRNSGG